MAVPPKSSKSLDLFSIETYGDLEIPIRHPHVSPSITIFIGGICTIPNHFAVYGIVLPTFNGHKNSRKTNIFVGP